MANGDEKLFKELTDSYDEIGRTLEKDNPNTKEVLKKFLATNRLIMAFFIGTFLDDHKKVETMWVGYRFMIFLSSVLGVSIISLVWALITGQATVSFAK